jgi:hypothetical protein
MGSEYKKTNTVVCFGDLKQAAIYFERVVPINTIELINYSDIPISENYSIDNYMRDREELLYKSLSGNMETVIDLIIGKTEGFIGRSTKKRIIKDLSQTTKALQLKLKNQYPQLFFNPSYVMDSMHEMQQQLIASELVKNNSIVELNRTPESILNDFCNTLKIKEFSLSLPSGMKTEQQKINTKDIQVTLLNLNLVDTTQASWEQIIELRNDPVLSSNLRNLKLMMHDSYSGKSLDYIHDDMQRRIEKYEHACKSMGLKTISSHISQIKNFASINGVSLALITAILSSEGFNLSNGLSLSAISAAAVGLVMYGLEIKSNSNELYKLKNENPVAYIIDANKKLK